MLTLLAQYETLKAQEPASSNVFEVFTTIFRHGDALAKPDQLIEALQSMSIVWSIILLVVGLLCLFNGYRYYRLVTVLLALFIGAFVGYALGKQIGAQWIVAGCMGVLMATICFPMMKYAVAALGGITGAYVGANAWSAISQLTIGSENPITGHYWVGAIVGLVLFGMLAFVLFKLSVIFFTTVSGSTISVLGCIALLLQFPLFRDHVALSLKAHAAIIPLLVLVPAAVGLIIQETKPGNSDKDPKAA